MAHHQGCSAYTQYTLEHGFYQSTQYLGQIRKRPPSLRQTQPLTKLHGLVNRMWAAIQPPLDPCPGIFVHSTTGWTSATIYDYMAWETIRVVTLNSADTLPKWWLENALFVGTRLLGHFSSVSTSKASWDFCSGQAFLPYHSVMVNFMCQFDGVMECTDIWLNII